MSACSTCATCGSTSLPCGCYAGTQVLTPVPIFNRPGLPALDWRVGSHGSFLATMKARLSTVAVAGVGADSQTEQTFRPLRALSTRDSSDFSIALLDSWATVADLLSFYTERIANEGYLRTATERRSVLELARLVGYTLRPGVAAGVYLAYTLDDNQIDPTTIAAGARAQSLPGPGETAQSFETSEDLAARREWNNLQVRLQRPQNIALATALQVGSVVVSNTVNGLRPGDPLLLLFSSDGSLAALRNVRNVRATAGPGSDGCSTITLDPVAPELAATMALLLRLVSLLHPHLAGADGATGRAIERAQELQQLALLDHDTDPASWAGDMVHAADGSIAAPVLALIGGFAVAVQEQLKTVGGAGQPVLSNPDQFVTGLLAERVPQVANSLRLRRDLGLAFRPGADTAPQLLLKFAPALQDSYYTAWAGANVNAAQPALLGVYVLRSSGALFGAGVSRQAFYQDGNLQPQGTWPEWTLDGERKDGLYLDQLHAAIAAPGYAVVSRLDGREPVNQVLPIKKATTAQRAAYGISGKTTQLIFARDWWDANAQQDMNVLRSTLVWAQSERLDLVQEPITNPVSGQEIELGALHKELTSGRWLILSGERADIPGVQGVRAAELMMISGLVHSFDATLPGDTTHTVLTLATATAFTYKRDTLVIYGNVVQASHGETHDELLGSGDATATQQAFVLKQPPLTFISAATVAGAHSTLAVYADDVQWQETPSLSRLGAKDRGYISSTDDSGATRVIFGDGAHGARLPTGVQNVRAIYRSGIGAPGNVRAEQISLLATRPLGVKAVINPLRASGGADREDRDLARQNAPLAVMALERLVSVQDYADFTRTFAGIDKALATRTSDGRHELVYLTIAGAADAPIDKTSALYRNLLAALQSLGDPDLPLRVDVRELRALVLSAGVALQPGYRWEPVASAVRARLLDEFGFARRALGQTARLAEVIAGIQSVRGVAYVDVDVFTSIAEKTSGGRGPRQLVTQGDITQQIAVALHGESEFNCADRANRADRPGDVPAFAGGTFRGQLRPAELAIFTPAVADTLILNPL